MSGKGSSDRWKGKRDEGGRDERDHGEIERVHERRGSGVWVGRCHFRYSIEPALCEHVGNTAHIDGAIKKMMSGRRIGITRG